MSSLDWMLGQKEYKKKRNIRLDPRILNDKPIKRKQKKIRLDTIKRKTTKEIFKELMIGR